MYSFGASNKAWEMGIGISRYTVLMVAAVSLTLHLACGTPVNTEVAVNWNIGDLGIFELSNKYSWDDGV